MIFVIGLDMNQCKEDFKGDYGKIKAEKEKNLKNRKKNSIQSLRVVFVGISQIRENDKKGSFCIK